MKSRVPNEESATGTITARKRKDGSVAYLARVWVMRDGFTYHETKTFDRRPTATSWVKKPECELAKPGVIAEYKAADPPLAKAIDRYIEESLKEIGRTKAQVLRAIKNYPIADMPRSTIKSKDIIEYLQSLTSQPQTVGSYASHLAAIFAIAWPMWDYRLDDREMRERRCKSRPRKRRNNSSAGGVKSGHLSSFCNERRRDRGFTPWIFI